MPYTPEDQRDYAQQYYRTHKKQRAEYMRQWRQRNRAKHRAYMAEYMRTYRATP
jgi:hypothetical protein